jgi:3-hydroxyacyl-CoA dehydrogenase
MAERGDATPHDIDTAMELGAGYRESPFFRVAFSVELIEISL